MKTTHILIALSLTVAVQGQTFGFAAAAVSGYSDLRDAIVDYRNDVRNHQDLAGAALLSVTAQQLIVAIPGMPSWVQIALSPTVPYFDPCPLGEYDGGSDCPYY